MKPNAPLRSLTVKIILAIGMLLTATQLSLAQVVVDYGKSYINITKGLNGGTVEPGDTLELRSTFVVRCTSGCPAYVDSCAYYDTVKTGMTYIPGSLAILTNEGKVYKAFTDAYGDDCGWISGNDIRINMGYNTAQAPATAFRRGRIRNDHKPSFYGNTAIMVASYRVVVTAALGSQINTGGGSISYKPTTSPSPLFVNLPGNTVQVFTNYGICTNTVGVNALGTETNGTFGSGKPRNRGTSASVPGTYIYNVFRNNSPQDYYYGIANNTSTQNYTTSNAWAIPDNSSPTHRVHNVWDIIGDHTGAADPLLGNPAADTVNNDNGGYMLVVNASYRIDSAFSHTITGLCPNTYYELSAWFRNICSKCGCDSNGKGATNSSGPVYYIPTAAGDSSGVHPNLTLKIDGIDYYTTGNMSYTGQWVKKGFTYVTGPAQTSLTMTIRNNAPGGGGNDWAIDDISIATCTPTLNLVPSGGVNVCYGNQVDMYTTVRCFTPNYVHWTWERSTDGGTNWISTGVSGVGSPTLVSGQYQYIASYPSFLADASVHNNQFRIRIASTAANLSNAGCSFSASNTIIVWVNDCSELLKTELTDVSGKTLDPYAQIQWTSTNEQAGVQFAVQRSSDNVNFVTVYTQAGQAANGTGAHYSYTDPQPMTGPTYYRIQVQEGRALANSKIVLLNNKAGNFGIQSLINPFTHTLAFEVLSPQAGKLGITLTDNYGRQVKSLVASAIPGVNPIKIDGFEQLPPGIYILRIRFGQQVITRKVIRQTLY